VSTIFYTTERRKTVVLFKTESFLVKGDVSDGEVDQIVSRFLKEKIFLGIGDR